MRVTFGSATGSTMRKSDKIVVVPRQAGSHRAQSLADSGGAQRSAPASNSSVAAALAVLPVKDDSPRVIRQYTSVFLVSAAGELWRVFDVDAAGGAEHHTPSAESRLPYRLFMSLAHEAELRLHTFADGVSHDIDPDLLQTQLDDSVPVV
jgi:hypothetical protein